VSQLEKREKMLIFRNGFTSKFLKKSIVDNFNRPLFSTKQHKAIATQSLLPEGAPLIVA
jgi:hypothetical protein